MTPTHMIHSVDFNAVDQLQDIFRTGKRQASVEYIKYHENYPAFLAALEEIGKTHGLTTKPDEGDSVAYVRKLHANGADPQHINAVATMLFL